MAKILAADNDENIRLLYSEELIEAGYDVITAESGFKLLKTIEEEKPDLVILEIKMEDCIGLELLLEIRNYFYDLPVILTTVYDGCKDYLESIEANFYVVKSCDLTELKRKADMALATRLPASSPALQNLPEISGWG